MIAQRQKLEITEFKLDQFTFFVRYSEMKLTFNRFFKKLLHDAAHDKVRLSHESKQIIT